MVNKWWKKFFPSEPAKPDDPNSPRWLRNVAMLTGVLAGFAGYLTVRSTQLSNDAIYRSTQAVLMQAQSSDKWAEYQADSIKASVADTAGKTASDATVQKTMQDESLDFRNRQPKLQHDALDLASQRDQQLVGGDRLLKEKDLLGYSGMAVQLAIALASVAALTRKQSLFHIAIVIGLLGILITGYAFMFHFHLG